MHAEQMPTGSDYHRKEDVRQLRSADFKQPRGCPKLHGKGTSPPTPPMPWNEFKPHPAASPQLMSLGTLQQGSCISTNASPFRKASALSI